MQGTIYLWRLHRSGMREFWKLFRICGFYHCLRIDLLLIFADEWSHKIEFLVEVINVWPPISSCITWLNWYSFWQILHLTKSIWALRIGRSTFCMLIIQSILTFQLIRRIPSAERIRGVSRYFWILKLFSKS